MPAHARVVEQAGRGRRDVPVACRRRSASATRPPAARRPACSPPTARNARTCAASCGVHVGRAAASPRRVPVVAEDRRDGAGEHPHRPVEADDQDAVRRVAARSSAAARGPPARRAGARARCRSGRAARARRSPAARRAAARERAAPGAPRPASAARKPTDARHGVDEVHPRRSRAARRAGPCPSPTRMPQRTRSPGRRPSARPARRGTVSGGRPHAGRRAGQAQHQRGRDGERRSRRSAAAGAAAGACRRSDLHERPRQVRGQHGQRDQAGRQQDEHRHERELDRAASLPSPTSNSISSSTPSSPVSQTPCAQLGRRRATARASTTAREHEDEGDGQLGQQLAPLGARGAREHGLARCDRGLAKARRAWGHTHVLIGRAAATLSDMSAHCPMRPTRVQGRYQADVREQPSMDALRQSRNAARQTRRSHPNMPFPARRRSLTSRSARRAARRARPGQERDRQPYDCTPDPTLTQPFAPFERPRPVHARRQPGLEAGAASWTLTGGAAVVAGNEPWFVARRGRQPRARPARRLVAPTTAPICIDETYTHFRLFARNAGSGKRSLEIDVLYYDTKGKLLATKPYGYETTSTAWQPTPRDRDRRLGQEPGRRRRARRLPLHAEGQGRPLRDRRRLRRSLRTRPLKSAHAVRVSARCSPAARATASGSPATIASRIAPWPSATATSASCARRSAPAAGGRAPGRRRRRSAGCRRARAGRDGTCGRGRGTRCVSRLRAAAMPASTIPRRCSASSASSAPARRASIGTSSSARSSSAASRSARGVLDDPEPAVADLLDHAAVRELEQRLAHRRDRDAHARRQRGRGVDLARRDLAVDDRRADPADGLAAQARALDRGVQAHVGRFARPCSRIALR